MRWWNELVTDNPMMIESKLFVRKFFGAHAIANVLALGAITLLLGLLIGMLYVYEVSYKGPAIGALVVLTILVPILLHASNAGERERRSWEMLLVAPITNAQIVIGKFMGAVNAILIVVAAFSFAIIVAFYPRDDRLLTAPIVILVILSYAIVLGAFTVLVSSWSKRSISAISIVYGSLFFLFLAFPMLFSATAPESAEGPLYVNPFYVVTQINEERYWDQYKYYSSGVTPEGPIAVNNYVVYGLMHIFLYSTIAVLCLWLATGSLNSSGLDDPAHKGKSNNA